MNIFEWKIYQLKMTCNMPIHCLWSVQEQSGIWNLTCEFYCTILNYKPYQE